MKDSAYLVPYLPVTPTSIVSLADIHHRIDQTVRTLCSFRHFEYVTGFEIWYSLFNVDVVAIKQNVQSQSNAKTVRNFRKLWIDKGHVTG